MPLTADAGIAGLLSDTRTIALVGASDRPSRPSYRVMRFLLEHGYEVYPVNPGLVGQQLQGRTVYGRLADVPVAIDLVDVFRQPRHLPALVGEAIAVGAGAIWTQLGVVDPAAAAAAEAAGLAVVMDRCPAIEWPRLHALGLIA